MGQENLPWDLVEGKTRADDPRFWPGGAQLSGESFENALIVDVDITAAELMGATFRNCTLARLDLRDGFMSEAHFENCTFYKCDLRRADLTDASLINVTIDRSNLCSAKFTGVKTESLRIMRSEVSPCDFRKSQLDGFFSYCDLSAVNFDQADIQNLELFRCNIKFSRVSAVKHECTTTGIEAAERAGDHQVPWFLTSSERLEDVPAGQDIEECYFFGKDLSGVDFSGRNLKLVNFLRCNLTGANFDNAILDNVWIWDCEVDQFHANKAKIPRLSMSYVMGSIQIKGSTLDVWNVYDSELEGSDFQGSTLNAGTFSMSQLPNSNFSNMPSFVAESFMTDFIQCNFGGTDTSKHAAERSYFDEDFTPLPISQSPLRHVSEAGDINFFYLPASATDESPEEEGKLPETPFQPVDDTFAAAETKHPEPIEKPSSVNGPFAPIEEEPRESRLSRPEFTATAPFTGASEVEVAPEAPKLDLKPAEPAPETKPAEPKLELKPEPKAETKPEPKLDLKPEPKAETKPEPKAELKPAAKLDSKATLKPDSKGSLKPSIGGGAAKKTGDHTATKPSIDAVRPTARNTAKPAPAAAPSTTSSDEVKRPFGSSSSSKLSPLGGSTLGQKKPSVPSSGLGSPSTPSPSPVASKPLSVSSPVSFGASNSSKLSDRLGAPAAKAPFGASGPLASAAPQANVEKEKEEEEVIPSATTPKPAVGEAPSIDLNMGADSPAAPETAAGPDVSAIPGVNAAPPTSRRPDAEATYSAPEATQPAPTPEPSHSTDLIQPEPQQLGFFARIIQWFKSLFG